MALDGITLKMSALTEAAAGLQWTPPTVVSTQHDASSPLKSVHSRDAGWVGPGKQVMAQPALAMLVAYRCLLL